MLTGTLVQKIPKSNPWGGWVTKDIDGYKKVLSSSYWVDGSEHQRVSIPKKLLRVDGKKICISQIPLTNDNKRKKNLAQEQRWQ